MMVGCKKTEDLLKDWGLWVKRVFTFAGVESRSRPAIKQLLLQHETAKDHFTNQDGKYTNLSLLSKEKVLKLLNVTSLAFRQIQISTSLLLL